MIRISSLLLLILVSFTDHVGSVVLTRSPLTASDGELFTLTCSSNTSSGQDRQWYRDDVLIFTTTQGSSSPGISNPTFFQKYLAGRVDVSCDVLQHNVTLRIISDTDSGTRWKCLDISKSQTSHTVTIHVTELQSRPAATLILSTTVITTTTEDKSLPKSTGTMKHGCTLFCVAQKFRITHCNYTLQTQPKSPHLTSLVNPSVIIDVYPCPPRYRKLT